MQCLQKHPVRVIVSLYHPWAVKQEITREDMLRETFLKMKMDTGHYKVSVEDSIYENIPCRDIQEISNFQTLFALLQQGEAFAVFPRAYVYMDQARVKFKVSSNTRKNCYVFRLFCAILFISYRTVMNGCG